MIHRHEPKHYHTTLGSHEPVLRLADGDTLVTTTVDARGQDHTGQTVTERGNPQTGPFYIEGAEPGDTLAVHLDSLVPNRPTGFTRPLVAANVLDPAYVADLARELPEPDSDCYWQMNYDDRTVTLISPDNTKLGRITLPMSPMLGCFGVAPPRGQAISTATSDVNGGNMDYRGFVEGVTVYFPVFVPGALFHVGDGHALQGDGEIVGTGIEISFDVQVTFSLLKGVPSRWPRGENQDYIFTVGNARPLDQALQHATTEMVRWLQEGFGLDPLGAHTLLGQCVEYDVGNVFDPAYTMVCKVPKTVLSQIGAAS
jgi:amidase